MRNNKFLSYIDFRIFPLDESLNFQSNLGIDQLYNLRISDYYLEIPSINRTGYFKCLIEQLFSRVTENYFTAEF